MVYIVEYGIDLGTMGNFLILLNVHIYSGGGGDAHGNAVRAFERDKSGGKGLQRVLAALGLSTQRRWKRAFCVTGLCHDPEDEDDDDEHEDDDDDDSDTSRAGSGIPGSVLETVRQKIGGCSSSEKLALQTVRKRLLLARLWAGSTAAQTTCAELGSAWEPQPEPDPQLELQPAAEPEQPELGPEPEPTAPASQGPVQTSSGNANAEAPAARQVKQQKTLTKKLAAKQCAKRAKAVAGSKLQPNRNPSTKKPRKKTVLPPNWAAEVTSAVSRLPNEVYERIGSWVEAAETAAAAAGSSPQAAASSWDGLRTADGSVAFQFGPNTFGKRNLQLPKFLKELAAACAKAI